MVIAAVVLIAAGAGVGVLIGSSVASSRADRDARAADRASEQEDAARDRRDLLDARIAYVDEQAKALPKVATTAPFLGSVKTSANVKPGATFSVDGGTYTVHGLRVLDEFESIDPQRPATPKQGYRWALIDLDYTNATRESQAPACGTMGVVHLVLDDRTLISEVSSRDEKPPVAQGTYDRCGYNVDPGRTVHWLAPVRIPEHAKVAGILVADIYVRTTHSSYNVQSGKQAWVALDKTLDVGENGDDETKLELGGDA